MSNQFNSNGRILFEGKSNIDGKNIVVIITGLTTNSLQTCLLLFKKMSQKGIKIG